MKKFTTNYIQEIKWILIPAFLSSIFIYFHFNKVIINYLQYDRQLIINYELWRIFSGHFVHWSENHLFWDLLPFTISAMICYRLKTFSFWIITLISPLFISTLLWVFITDMVYYRGLSGINVALYSYLALYFFSKLFSEKNYKLAIFGFITYSLMITKIIYETLTNNVLFINDNSFTPVSLAHFAGALFSLILWLSVDIRKIIIKK